jgi:5-methylcytosine-specific restriction endonuclease McrA
VKDIRYWRERVERYAAALERDQGRRKREQEQRAQLAQAVGKTRDLAGRLKDKLIRAERCPYCDGPLGSDAHADHIYPVAKGGQSRLENMVFVCSDCNAQKSNLTLNAFIHEFGLDRDAIEARLRTLGKDF